MSPFVASVACRLAIESICEGRKTYLWTFTTARACTGADVSRVWQAFSERMAKEFPGWCGVRVYEVHPGGHGWHVHFVTTRFVWVRFALRIGQLAGFGRMNVKKISAGRASYIAKYLGKERDRDKGLRMWAVVGKKALREAGLKWARASSIVVEGEQCDIARRAWEFVSAFTDKFHAKREFVRREVLAWLCDRPSQVPMAWGFTWQNDFSKPVMEAGFL